MTRKHLLLVSAVTLFGIDFSLPGSRSAALAQEPPPAAPSTLAPLIAELDSDDWATREKAQAALDEMGRPAIPALEAAFAKEPEGERRERLRTLLTDLGVFAYDAASRQRILECIEALVPAPVPAVNAGGGPTEKAKPDPVWELGEAGYGAIPLVIDTFDSEPRERRERARDAAVRIVHDHPLALNALIHACRDPRWRVRYYAAMAIGASGPEPESGEAAGQTRDASSEAESGNGETPPIIEPARLAPSAFALRIEALRARRLPVLVSLRTDPQDGVRWAAARAIARRGDAGAGEALPAFLGDLAGEVREAAARGLARHGGPAQAPALAALLSGEGDPAVRASACWALGQIGAAESEPALVRALGDREASVRAHAAGALGHLQGTATPAGLAALLAALADAEESVVIAAGESLASRGDASITAELVRFLEKGAGRWRDRAARCLAKYGSADCAAALIVALGDSDVRIRTHAASGLGRLAHVPAAPPLSRLLAGEKEADVRRVAAHALGEIGNADGIEALLAALGDPDPAVRRHVASALGSCAGTKEPGPQAALAKALASESAETREGAALALGKLGQASARDPLLKVLKNDDAAPETRAAAAWWLGRLGDPAVVPDLTRVLVNDALDAKIRVNAASSLAALKAPKAAADIEAFAKKAPPSVRGTLAGALLALGSSAGIPLLILDCASPDASVRTGAARSLRELCGADLPAFDPAADPATTRDARRALLRWWRLHREALEKKTSEEGK